MTTSIASPRRWRGALADGALLLGAVFLVPLIIIVIGAPIALGVRIVIEITRRVWQG